MKRPNESPADEIKQGFAELKGTIIELFDRIKKLEHELRVERERNGKLTQAIRLVAKDNHTLSVALEDLLSQKP